MPRLVDTFEKNGVDNSRYKIMRKIGNKIFEIMAKSWNLPKTRSKNLFKSKNLIKTQNTSIIREPKFLNPNIKIVFTLLK